MRTAEAWALRLMDLGLHGLNAREAFAFFLTLVNYDEALPGATRTTAPTRYFDYFIADSPVECTAITCWSASNGSGACR